MRIALSPWDALALAGLALAGALYARGSHRLATRGARVRRAERVSFWAGWTILVCSVAPPLDAWAEQSLAAHMAQHELMLRLGAPLLIVGRPIVPWLWALPGNTGVRAGTRVLGRGPLNRLWSILTTPLVAFALHAATVWGWHLPALYERAVLHEGVHAAQHAMFVGTAVVFWWGLVQGRYGRAAYGASVFYVFLTMVHTGVLGAVFALSTAPFYTVYSERAAVAGLDAVTDQQLAGMVAWIPAGLVLTACGLALLVAWMSEADRRTRASQRLLMVLIAVASFASACSPMPYEAEARRLTGGDPWRGRELIAQRGCGTCHTIPGVPKADATVGPPLTAVARRVYLMGRLENTPVNMQQWIAHPRSFDPGTAMPDLGLSDTDSRDIVAYLYTLR